ncbi:Methyltransferase type 11 [Segniliparus rotundus DSM 44985]|uniref:Methyltransferase type 11 n=1 Tax=Segniliparus rotundus (strain ATCC BAA-972 / CDC 1076 / CIP 108378 / DSM 44985 / JCM 13578) TaxID=640132 RepID=D6ZDG8_SEGRD|nr:class I SAM-dependent methyltransferase [Segniliparus rotundus]ADG97232.1 Methyltransferase type 11 [Segniliparus rotundus DSM 44985]
MDQDDWNELYQEHEHIWSGLPNAALVAEVSDLAPGLALDVGCGEGGDASWLAEHGWKVVAADISSVAIERAAAAVPQESVTWLCADLVACPPEPKRYDLVSLQYYPLPLAAGEQGASGFIEAVAIGGVLLVVGHDMHQHAQHQHKDPRFNPADYYVPSQIADLLDSDWEILMHEARRRERPLPDGSEAPDDLVLKAVRRR